MGSGGPRKYPVYDLEPGQSVFIKFNEPLETRTWGSEMGIHNAIRAAHKKYPGQIITETNIHGTKVTRVDSQHDTTNQDLTLNK